MSTPIRPRMKKVTTRVVSEEGVELENNASQYKDEGLQQTDIESDIPKIPSKYTPVTLLSNAAFYGGIDKDIHIRPLTLADILKVNSSIQTEDHKVFIEVINSTIYEAIDLNKMSDKDFQQLLYWLRLNSTYFHEMTIPFTCDHEDHLDLIEQGTVDVESMIQEHTVTQTKLKDKYLTEESVAELTNLYYKIKDDYGISVDYSRLDDQLELTRLADKRREIISATVSTEGVSTEVYEMMVLEKLQSDKHTEIAQCAAYLVSNDIQGHTLADKIKFLVNHENISQAAIDDIKEYIDVYEDSHGVSEIAQTTCEVCGAEIKTVLSISASDFQ